MYLKISKFLEKLSFKLRQKGLYFELKHYIVKGESHLTPTYNYTRGIGKTYTLLQLAHKYDCPIVVRDNRDARRIADESQYMFNKPVKTIVASDRCRGMRYSLLLCEQGIDNRLIHEVIRPMCKQIVGYEFWY